MTLLDCVLIIDEDNTNDVLHEGKLGEIGVAENIIVEKDKDRALEFLEKGCLIEKKHCPEFIFMDIGMRSIHDPDFYDTLRKINNAITSKIQVIFLLDNDNRHELQEIKDLGIDYLFKPLNKEKLENLFNRYFSLKRISI